MLLGLHIKPGIDRVRAVTIRESNRRRWVFAVVASSVFMINLDLWIVNVALEAIGRDLPGASLAGLSWVLNAYAVTLAALLTVAGRAGDRLGTRRLFLLGTALFTAASAACALAPSLPALVAARVVQAAGAAMMMPSSLALLLASVPAERRHSAARAWSVIGALAAATGPVIGGLLVGASWRWVFVINLPVGLAALAAGRRVLPHPPERPREPLPDLVGSGLLIVAVAALTGAIVQGPGWGWTSGAVLGLLALAGVGLASFVWRCAHHPAPLVELALMRVRTFAVANAGVFLFSAAFAIMLLSNALWCQGVWHYSALRTGLAMAAGPAVVPFAAIASNRAVKRYGAGPVSAVGCVLFAAGLGWRTVAAGVTPDYVRDLLPSMLIGGAGVGLALSTLIASGTTALPPDRSATGAAVLNTGRQVASSLGVAILVAFLGSGTIRGAGVGAFDRAWIAAAGLALIGAVASLYLPAGGAERAAAARPRGARAPGGVE
jgi:EmrB/QacA subfamily drug resistance transporter